MFWALILLFVIVFRSSEERHAALSGVYTSFFMKPGVFLDNIATIKMPLFSFQRWIVDLLACSYSAP